MDEERPQIGKDVIESLTTGMYEDCRFIYREYIQNAADAVDKAVSDGILKKGEEEISIEIDRHENKIIIEDNATGIVSNRVVPILRNIAHSDKTRGEDKGFRGIGRLGGLAYCDTLRFETSYKGEPLKSIMVWDAKLLRRIINDRTQHEEATDVLEKVTEISTKKEDINNHYFKVIMEGVSSKENILLDKKNVEDYLCMVAPVEINSRFIYRNEIKKFMKEHNLSLDTYNITINGEQLYKPYTSDIYKETSKNKKKEDDILGVDFLLRKDNSDNIIYWGWYSISRLKGQMTKVNTARGIRLRSSNIQIGDEEICKRFFTKTNDQRFSFYFFGEIHAIGNGLIPNSRRDYFGETKELDFFEEKIMEDFIKLRSLCYDAENLRSNQKIITQTIEKKKIIQKRENAGWTNPEEKERSYREYGDLKEKSVKAEAELAEAKEKIKNSESPLSIYVEKIAPTIDQNATKSEEPQQPQNPPKKYEGKSSYRTYGPKYSRYETRDKKLISKIYNAITRIFPPDQSENIIDLIEKEITK